MSTLDDKILGEKLQYYCSSSSEDEGHDDSANSDKESDPSKSSNVAPAPDTTRDFADWDGTSSNTGPKGVIKDWQRFKRIESEKRAEQDKEKIELIKKLSITCQSSLDEERNKALTDDPDLAELMSDEFLLAYQKQRMLEMMAKVDKLQFGKVIQLESADQFVNAIDDEDKSVTVIVHIYQNNVPGCEAMNGCLLTLAKDYPYVKFCKISASKVGVSKHFKKDGTPAILAYKNGQMIGNFVHVSASLGDDFYAADVEAFLTEHGILRDKNCVPPIIKNDMVGSDDSD